MMMNIVNFDNEMMMNFVDIEMTCYRGQLIKQCDVGIHVADNSAPAIR